MDFTIDIARPVEHVFALIADLPNYHRWLLSRLTIDIRYRLEPLGAHTRVYRTTTPRLSGVLALLRPMLVRSIRSENLRTLAMMKQYLEHEGRA
jgi:hypothetical protein